jgi:uncharacterized membrane-anchored protein YjiN (DUF445 family)
LVSCEIKLASLLEHLDSLLTSPDLNKSQALKTIQLARSTSIQLLSLAFNDRRSQPIIDDHVDFIASRVSIDDITTGVGELDRALSKQDRASKCKQLAEQALKERY